MFVQSDETERVVAQGQWTGWCVSLALHIVLLVVLAIQVSSEVTSANLVLQVARVDDVQPVDLMSPDSDAAPDSRSRSAPGGPPLNIPVVTLRGTEVAGSGGGREELLHDFDRLAELAEPESPSQGQTSFFGVSASGNRFVFLIDGSRSMQGLRWQMARYELLTTLDGLNEQQSFFVLYFDDRAYPMFGRQNRQLDFLPATAENLTRLRQWIDSIQVGLHTDPFPAVQIGMRLKPDAMFIVSDGEFAVKTRMYLRETNKRARKEPIIPVHTVALSSRQGGRELKNVAQENGGVYQFVSVGQWRKKMGK